MSATGTPATAGTGLRVVLTPPVRRMLFGQLSNALGGGLVLSLLIVYLVQVRGLATIAAGAVMSWMAVLSLLVAPLAGLAIDHWGPRRVLIAALAVEAVGVGLFSQAHDLPSALLAGTLAGIGGAGLWPAQSAMLAGIAPPEHRQRVFGLQFMLLNLGLGLGGLVGAAIIDVTRPGTFVALYLLAAGSYLGYLVAVASLRGYGGKVVSDGAPDDAAPDVVAPDDGAIDADGIEDPGAAAAGRGGYREVLADRRVRRLLLASIMLTTCGYGSLEAGLPAFATGPAGVSAKALGVVFFVNTAVIVVAQLLVLRRIEGRSRARVLAGVGVLWALCWLLVGASALVGGLGAAAAVGVLCLAAGVFALGETLWSPVQPALLNDLAPPHLRGRYNALGSVVWNVGAAIGPLLVGLMLGAGLAAAWVGLVAVGCLAAGAVALGLRHLLTAEQDGRAPHTQAVGGSPA